MIVGEDIEIYLGHCLSLRLMMLMILESCGAPPSFHDQFAGQSLNFEVFQDYFRKDLYQYSFLKA